MLLTLFAVIMSAAAPTARAECFDFRDYLHTVGRTMLDGIPKGVCISGDHAYAATWQDGLQVVDISFPESPLVVGQVPTTGNIYGVVVADGYAYLPKGPDGVAIVDVADPAAPMIIAEFDTPGHAEDVVVRNGWAYVADNDNGVLVVDVSDPALPVVQGSIPGVGHVDRVDATGSHLVTVGASSGIRILDPATPSAPAIVGQYTDPNLSYTHVVATETTFCVAWRTVFQPESYGISYFVLSDPTLPLPVSHAATSIDVSDLTVSGTTVLAGVWGGIHTFDFSTPDDPRLIGFDNGGSAANDHFVYLDAEAALACGFAQANGELFVLDITNPSNAVPTHGLEFAEALDIALAGDFACVSTEANEFLIFDILNPAEPVLAGSCTTSSPAEKIETEGGLAYLACGADGLMIVDLGDPATVAVIGGLSTTGAVSDVDLDLPHAYLATGSGLLIVDVGDPTAPVVTGSTATGIVAVSVDGDFAFGVNRMMGLETYDVSNKVSPVLVGNYIHFPCGGTEVVAGNGLAYMTCSSGLEVYDVSDPANPILTGTAAGTGYRADLVVRGTTAFVADIEIGINVIDVGDPTSPTVAHTIFVPGLSEGLAVSDENMFLVNSAYWFFPEWISLNVLPVPCGSNPAAIPDFDVEQPLLRKAFPNPFNPSVTIEFELGRSETVNLQIHDVRGHHVRTLIGSEPRSTGIHKEIWDGRDRSGREAASGIYLIHLETPTRTVNGRVALIR